MHWGKETEFLFQLFLNIWLPTELYIRAGYRYIYIYYTDFTVLSLEKGKGIFWKKFFFKLFLFFAFNSDESRITSVFSNFWVSRVSTRSLLKTLILITNSGQNFQI